MIVSTTGASMHCKLLGDSSFLTQRSDRSTSSWYSWNCPLPHWAESCDNVVRPISNSFGSPCDRRFRLKSEGRSSCRELIGLSQGEELWCLPTLINFEKNAGQNKVIGTNESFWPKEVLDSSLLVEYCHYCTLVAESPRLPIQGWPLESQPWFRSWHKTALGVMKGSHVLNKQTWRSDVSVKDETNHSTM